MAPLILTHFQKYGCDAIAETLIDLLELVRPFLASKDIPEFTSDDILDAIDVQWHSSVRSSPGFGSLRGSRAPSPLQSPRVSFSNLSPRRSISSPQSPFSIDRILGSSPGQIPYALTSPRKTQSFSFSPPSSLPDTGREDARAAPPRRSLSSHYPGSDVGHTQSFGGRLQPLTEHDEETNTGFGKSRMHDNDSVEPSPKDEGDSRENLSSHGADEDNVLSRSRPQSSSTSTGSDGSNRDFEKNSIDFSTVDHDTLSPVLPYNLSIPRSSIPFEVEDLNGDESARRTQIGDGHGHCNDDAGDSVRVDKMVGVPTPQVAIEKQLQTARDECEEVQEAKDPLLPNSMFEDSSTPTLDHENVMAILTHSPNVKEVEDENTDVSEVSSLVESCEHAVQKEIAPARDTPNECEIIVATSSSPFQGCPLRCLPSLYIYVYYVQLKRAFVL